MDGDAAGDAPSVDEDEQAAMGIVMPQHSAIAMQRRRSGRPVWDMPYRFLMGDGTGTIVPEEVGKTAQGPVPVRERGPAGVR